MLSAFLDRKAERIVLEQETVFYRVYGGSARKVGAWATVRPYVHNRRLIRKKLALNNNWKTKVARHTTVTLPRGTVIWRGLAAPQLQKNGKLLPGGAEQIWIQGDLDPSWYGKSYHIRR